MNDGFRIYRTWIIRCLVAAACTHGVMAQDDDEESDEGGMIAATFSGLKLRSVGPALMSGRICDFAVNPENTGHYYVAVCSGNVWKTSNAGTTYEPVFDSEGSYSVGCVTMDPHNPNVIWVGSGENNSQRSVSFGDGVYKSIDGGKNWKNVGLPESEHIGMIAIDPRDSDVVYVAAQGPLWRSGGDRGLYKTTDGGQTWNRILHISDDTGVNEVHLDPRNADVMYASAYQRRRHVWTLINGGPESAIYKSTDAGTTWRKLTRGIPAEDMGRIGMDIAPANPDVIYAIIEASGKAGGFFRSLDRGETWEKRNDYMSSSPQYYNEIVCDPNDADRVYTLDTFMHVTEDGGKTFKRVKNTDRHVDDHALWINPNNSDHLLVGCDGGIYESYDRAENWNFKPNLPVTQFYRIAVDESKPFYYVYGGTQDNNTQGGPSQTTDRAGITNEDWFVTVGGDGYETQIDPTDPMIVYSLWQYGGLVRHDRRSGEIVDIKPREKPGEDPFKWNWDTPLIISPHSHTRLYFAAQKLFRSDDRGDSWAAVSDDLTRQIDRNTLPVMGKVHGVDAVAKNNSTSFYGNCVSLSESPLVEGLIYVGTDDGVISVTEDGGDSWRQNRVFPTVPDITYVSDLEASRHDPDTVFATFDNHKNGDFKPYILKSTDRGRTWQSITGDLPARDTVLTLSEDHERQGLLFAGTEFGVYFTIDGGQKWVRLKGGIPTISVRDLEIQRRENDLVVGTFGRGIYILDDYTALRDVSDELLAKEAHVFPVKSALRFIQRTRLGDWSGRGSQGASYFAAPNPPFGAVFTYYLKDKLMSRKERRQKAEKKLIKAGKSVSYPTWDALRAEDEEHEPQILLIVRDDADEIVRRIEGSRDKGMHKANWDLRFPASTPTQLKPPQDRPPWLTGPTGPIALPGTYTVTLAKHVDGVVTDLTDPVTFNVVPLDLGTFPEDDREAVLAFRQDVAELRRAVRGALAAAGEAGDRIAHLRKAIMDTPDARHELLTEADQLQKDLTALLTKLRGDQTIGNRSEPTPRTIRERVEDIVDSQWYATTPPTQTQRDEYRYAGEEFTGVLAELRSLIEGRLQQLENNLEAAGAPWTPGRLPTWQME